MSEPEQRNATVTGGAEPSQEHPPHIDWEDSSVPVGDSPRLPYWPLALAGVVWTGWVIFLFMMMLSSRPA